MIPWLYALTLNQPISSPQIMRMFGFFCISVIFCAMIHLLIAEFALKILYATFLAAAACRSIFGGFHRPSIISCFGQYSRIKRLNASLGAGSQFDSFSLPGDWFWM